MTNNGSNTQKRHDVIGLIAAIVNDLQDGKVNAEELRNEAIEIFEAASHTQKAKWNQAMEAAITLVKIQKTRRGIEWALVQYGIIYPNFHA